MTITMIMTMIKKYKYDNYNNYNNYNISLPSPAHTLVYA